MAISLGSIVVELLANTAAFQAGMSKASYEGRKAAKEISQSFHEMGSKIGGASSVALTSLGELGSVVGELSKNFSEAFSSIGEGSNSIASAVTALGGFAAAGIAAAAGLSLMAKEGAEVTERLAHISEKTGISTHDLQVFEAAGKTVGVSLEDIQGLNQQLAQFITTGKGLSLKSIGQNLETNLVGSILRKGESSLFGSLGKAFGLGDGSKPDGSSQNAALWVQMATGTGALAAAGVGTLPLGSLGNVASLLGGGNSLSLSSIGKIAGGIGKGIGSIFGSLGSFFGGFLADGGDAQPGRAYIVGEKRPELFVPRSAGTVVPSLATADGSGKSTTITIHQHIHGVTDADSFKKSGAQISSAMGSAVSRGQQRNGR
jgi:hypothetical protein